MYVQLCDTLLAPKPRNHTLIDLDYFFLELSFQPQLPSLFFFAKQNVLVFNNILDLLIYGVQSYPDLSPELDNFLLFFLNLIELLQYSDVDGIPFFLVNLLLYDHVRGKLCGLLQTIVLSVFILGWEFINIGGSFLLNFHLLNH